MDANAHATFIANASSFLLFVRMSSLSKPSSGTRTEAYAVSDSRFTENDLEHMDYFPFGQRSRNLEGNLWNKNHGLDQQHMVPSGSSCLKSPALD